MLDSPAPTELVEVDGIPYVICPPSEREAEKVNERLKDGKIMGSEFWAELMLRMVHNPVFDDQGTVRYRADSESPMLGDAVFERADLASMCKQTAGSHYARVRKHVMRLINKWNDLDGDEGNQTAESTGDTASQES